MRPRQVVKDMDATAIATRSHALHDSGECLSGSEMLHLRPHGISSHFASEFLHSHSIDFDKGTEGRR